MNMLKTKIDQCENETLELLVLSGINKDLAEQQREGISKACIKALIAKHISLSSEEEKKAIMESPEQALGNFTEDNNLTEEQVDETLEMFKRNYLETLLKKVEEVS